MLKLIFNSLLLFLFVTVVLVVVFWLCKHLLILYVVWMWVMM